MAGGVMDTLRATYDVAAVRSQFPILGRRVHGKPLVYLDSAASAQKPDCVIDAMAHQMRTSYANVHRGLHTLANETTEAYEAARAKVARFINSGSASEVVFTKGATEAVNLVAHGLTGRLAPNDEIVVSIMEHHANIVPWHMLAERTGAKLIWIGLNDDGSLDMAQYAATLGPATKIVALTHMSNVLGTRTDGAEIVRLAHAVGADVLLDGCQAVVHGNVDVTALGVDYYVFSGHKLYGPTGIGVLYGRADKLAGLPPYQGGGEMIETVGLDRVTYAEPPTRFEAGTPPIIEAVGLGAAIDFLEGLDRAGMHAHEQALLEYASAALQQVNGLRIHGTAAGKGGVISFSVEGLHPHDLAQILDRYGVAIRAGQHCAQPLMAHLGVTGTARASFGCYSTFEDVDVFLEALGKARAMLA